MIIRHLISCTIWEKNSVKWQPANVMYNKNALHNTHIQARTYIAAAQWVKNPMKMKTLLISWKSTLSPRLFLGIFSLLFFCFSYSEKLVTINSYRHTHSLSHTADSLLNNNIRQAKKRRSKNILTPLFSGASTPKQATAPTNICAQLPTSNFPFPKREEFECAAKKKKSKKSFRIENSNCLASCQHRRWGNCRFSSFRSGIDSERVQWVQCVVSDLWGGEMWTSSSARRERGEVKIDNRKSRQIANLLTKKLLLASPNFLVVAVVSLTRSSSLSLSLARLVVEEGSWASLSTPSKRTKATDLSRAENGGELSQNKSF